MDEALKTPASRATAGDSSTAFAGREVHLKDLFAVVMHHWRLVAILAFLVAAAAYVSGRDAVTQFRSQLTVQITSPKRVFGRMDDIDVDELALLTDPILSEALVLTTQQLALRVVDALALQLELADPATFRGDAFSSIQVAPDAPLGEYTLRMSASPGQYQLLNRVDGRVLWTGGRGESVAGPGFSFRLLPEETPENGIDFRIVSREAAAAWVSAGIWYGVREATTAVDITFTGSDPTLVPHVLNQAALQLRLDGVERARVVATQRGQYVREQLERADRDLQAKLRELQEFKEGQQITNLTASEQSIVQSIRSFEQQRQETLIQTATLREALSANDSIGVEALNRLAAQQGTAGNAAVAFQIQNLLDLYEERRTLTAGAAGLREDNPQVSAIDQRISAGHSALRGAMEAALDGLEDRLAALTANVENLRTELSTFPGKETRIAQLEIERGILHDTYSYLLGQYQQAQMQEATIAPYVSILDGASPPSPIGTNLRQKVLLGLLVGLLLGVGGAFFLEYLDQTVKTAADVERVVGAPVLGLIPYEPKLVAGANGGRKPILAATALSPDDPTVEAYRSLRTNVTFVSAERPVQLLAVTSPGPGEGKTTTVANLALILALSGSKVLLIDADLRRPILHRAFQLVDQPGLTDVLIGNVSLREALRPDVSKNLDVLPSGARPPNPSELLGSDAMRRLLSDARRDYEYIVMDTPPALPVTDASVVGASMDAMVVVMRSGETEETAAQRTMSQLERVHARIAGVVLNGVSRRHDRYYSYYSDSSSRKERSPARNLKARISRMF
jgi:tyrosine-protein kinase Etk/Wzc